MGYPPHFIGKGFCRAGMEPKLSEVWVVVPLSRRGNVPLVRHNFLRQELPGKRLIVVENGDAVGACAAHGFCPDLLVTSERSAASARNTALETLRRLHPDAYFVNMDDDDWYGPDYLWEHAALARRGQLVGKSTHFVLFEGRGLVLFRPWVADSDALVVNGGTLGAFVSEAPEYPRLSVGEDTGFCIAFRERGGSVWGSSIYHTAYVRRRDMVSHSYRETDPGFWRNMGHYAACFREQELEEVASGAAFVGGSLGTFRHESWIEVSG